jgi:hypothetical protein
MEKVEQGFCRLIPWSQLRKRFKDQKKLKVHPVAAVEHKSRTYRMILNLSDKGRGKHKDRPSLNESTVQEAAPLKSMEQLGKVLPRIIYALATWDEDDGPVLLVKLDLKDGFWRLSVPEDDEQNFCYVLPKLEDSEETMMVVPSALQMGWTSSPPFFCAATETGRDVAEELRKLPPSGLNAHRYENDMIKPAEPGLFDKVQHPSQWNEEDIQQRIHNVYNSQNQTKSIYLLLPNGTRDLPWHGSSRHRSKHSRNGAPHNGGSNGQILCHESGFRYRIQLYSKHL